jgi:hypothetical protein
MTTLNDFEKRILREICNSAPAAALTALEAQLAAATVETRENTGAGFFTHLATDRSIAPLKDGVIGEFWANVVGLKNPMVFLLFVRNGYVDFLEGATAADSTVGMDFSNQEFERI